MITISRYDANLIYTGETAEHDGKGAIPRGWVAAEPPEGEGIWQWKGSAWGKLAEYPTPPEPPAPAAPSYSKLKIVETIDGMGKLDEFAGMLAQAPTRVQMRWQAATALEGDDADLQAVVLMIQAAWELTDGQVVGILKQCEL